jgi:transcriptional regulator with XRE-family HTH domain
VLSTTLKHLRKNSGYTQRQIADALHIDRSTYSCYETGKTIPDIETILKLSKIFNIPYIEILELENNPFYYRVNDVAGEVPGNLANNKIKNLNYIYELTKPEKRIISFYRILPEEQKQIVADYITEKVVDFSIQEKKNKNKKNP